MWLFRKVHPPKPNIIPRKKEEFSIQEPKVKKGKQTRGSLSLIWKKTELKFQIMEGISITFETAVKTHV